jgi:hypothetical protein
LLPLAAFGSTSDILTQVVQLRSMQFDLRSLLNAASITAELLKRLQDMVGRCPSLKVKLMSIDAVVLIAGPRKASLHISVPLQNSLFRRVSLLNVYPLIFLIHLQVICVLQRAAISHA